jgi:hypothetical protein
MVLRHSTASLQCAIYTRKSTEEGLETPSHAVKDGRRYRYYISQRLMQARRRDKSGWRLPSEEIESRVIAAVRGFRKDHQRLFEIIDVEGREAHAVQQVIDRVV